MQQWKQKRRERKVLDDCGCFIKCLKCGDIQNDNAECKKLDDHRYEYTCGGCGNVAIALYGVFPMPVWQDTVLQTKQKITDLSSKFAALSKPKRSQPMTEETIKEVASQFMNERMCIRGQWWVPVSYKEANPQQEILTLLQSDEAREKVKTASHDATYAFYNSKACDVNSVDKVHDAIATAALNALVQMIKGE